MIVFSKRSYSMNVIQIVSDTFRRDHLGFYGNNWIDTKNLDKIARESAIFDKAYLASFATIPCRHDLFTGRYTTFTTDCTNNTPLPKDVPILPQILRQAGYTTMLIADTYHLLRDGNHFDRGFDGWWMIRGQEFDRCMTNSTIETKKRENALGIRHSRNIQHHRFESDCFVAQTMTSAVKWLELNYNQHDKFFLYLDTFDPHEPWDPPKWYADMYDPHWKGGDVLGGAYRLGKGRGGRWRIADDFTENELNRLRALYAGEVTLVDRWIGLLLRKVEDLGLLENTAIIFTSDHGTFIGEHGYLGKSIQLFEEVAHIPLIIRMPDSEGFNPRRYDSLVQSPDLMPTILDVASVKVPSTVQARSLVPLIRGEETNEREIAISASSLYSKQNLALIRNMFLPWIAVTSKEWAFLATGNSVPETDQTGRKIIPELYHLATDPNETRNFHNEKINVAKDLRAKMIDFMRRIGTKQDVLSNWM